VKKLQTKIRNYRLFSSKNISRSAKKPYDEKKLNRTSKLWQRVQLIAVRKQNASKYKPVA